MSLVGSINSSRISRLNWLGAIVLGCTGLVSNVLVRHWIGCDTVFLFPICCVIVAAMVLSRPALLFTIVIAAVGWTAFIWVRNSPNGVYDPTTLTPLMRFVGVAMLVVVLRSVRDSTQQIKDLVVEYGRRPGAAGDPMASTRDQRDLINGLPQLIWTSKADGHCDFVNARWSEYSGLAPESHLGVGWTELVHADDRPKARAAWQTALAAQSAMTAELRLRRHDGIYHWFEVRAIPVHNDLGAVTRWFCTNVDIEDRRRTNQKFRRLYESNVIGIAFCESGGRLSSMNDALLAMLGYTREDYEREGLDWRVLVPHAAQEADGRCWDQLRQCGECEAFEMELKHKNGSTVPVLVSRAELEPGKHDNVVAIIVDLTRFKQVEQALRNSEAELRAANSSLERRVRQRTTELEAQSEQLRGLARDLAETESRERKRFAQLLHDHFQQLVSAAKMKIGIMRRRSGDDATIESLKSTEGLLDEALTASRSLATELSPPVLHDVGLAAGIEWLVRRMEQNHNLTIQLNLRDFREPDNEQVRTILFECIRELLFNIVKHSGVSSAELTMSAPPDGLLHVGIIDRGKGFDTKHTDFNAKPDGTFGLFSIRERLGLVGGLLKITSAVGRGTTVEMTVPAAFRPQGESHIDPLEGPPVAPAASGSKRICRVLVADDHKLFREGLIAMLNQEPYLSIVGEASDGQEAVDLARQLRPDIMIVDVTMPKLNGVQVTAMVSKELPSVKIIGLSMHKREDLANAVRNAGAIAYCAKSAPIETLVNILRNAAAETAFSSPINN